MKKLNLALIIASTLFMSSAFANVTECAGHSSSDRNAKEAIQEAKKLAGNNVSKPASNKRVVKQGRAG